MSENTEFNVWLQSRLTSHGFSVGPIDGIIGDKTLNALKSFQSSRGLRVTGIADEPTVLALRQSSAILPPEAVGTLPNRDPLVQEPTPPPPTGSLAFKNNWPRQPDCMSFYGNVGTNQTIIQIPYNMYLAWNGDKVSRMSVHSKVAASVSRILTKVAGIYSESERRTLGLDQFGGALNVRKMRGGTSWSMHSWGIALDFDPSRNGLNVKAPQARLSHADALPFWKTWEDEGWLSLGRARNFDWMHVQAARL